MDIMDNRDLELVSLNLRKGEVILMTAQLNNQRVATYVPRDVKKLITSTARYKGVSESEIVRQIIDWYYQRSENGSVDARM
jgi:hypothetical protein